MDYIRDLVRGFLRLLIACSIFWGVVGRVPLDTEVILLGLLVGAFRGKK